MNYIDLNINDKQAACLNDCRNLIHLSALLTHPTCDNAERYLICSCLRNYLLLGFNSKCNTWGY